MNELVLSKITKIYNNGIRALDEFSYTFSNGLYGLLGPNGAGKSSLVKVICQSTNSKGHVFFNGEEMTAKDIALIGVMPQQQVLYPKFTVNEFMFYMAALKNIKRSVATAEVEKLLSSVELSEYRKSKISSLSGGMKQRLLIAQALLGNPPILIFDEPTAGLDPKQRIEIRNLLAGLAEDHIVIITTHIVSDVESVAKEVIFLDKGRIVASDTVKNLQQKLNGLTKIATVTNEELDSLTDERFSILESKENDTTIRITTTKQFDVEQIVYPNLEDIYLYFVGE